MANGLTTNGTGKLIAIVAGVIATLGLWTGAVYAFATHVGDHDIHQSNTAKTQMMRLIAEDETDDLKELILEKLASIDRRLGNLEDQSEE